MDISAILNNLKEKGPVETIKIRRNRRISQKLYAKMTMLYTERPFVNYSERKFNSIIKKSHRMEEELARRSNKLLKKYKGEIKKHYLIDLVPKTYDELAKKPVQEKVVFVEKDNPITAPNKHISEVLTEQGRYEVKMFAVKMRTGSRLEHFELLMSILEDVATSKAIFISSANDFFSNVNIRPETKLIQLWHGLGVYKKLGFSTIDNEHFGKSAKQMEMYNSYWNYSYVTIPSMEQAWIFEDSMHIPASSGKLVPIGVARTDEFFDEKFLQKTYDNLYAIHPNTKGKKVILYAPTYRGRTATATAPDAMDYHAMAEALGDEYVLLVKHHGLAKNLPPIPEDLDNKFVFDLNRHPIGAIEKCLPVADICITDYSSIAFEYALFERPLIFFAYDLEDYLDKRGMYYSYDEITPGPICRTTEEIIDYILSIKDNFDKTEISAFRQKHVGACDGHSTERTIALIES